ncbi:hypothetical protein MVI27_07055 [Chryseobacterium salipaludis]|uniref:hypothetical protein n=1 Tax=Chryseobacterium TaxID=59732 RepID=UPI001FF62680|nr:MULTISPECIES: hypothetical protein [Chryseobacterium]MCJ8498015.1 hypothetical protein [Chryseobacterium salipaludis]MCX3296786.1 hypothetical protein [Planobacterium sp. JC490]
MKKLWILMLPLALASCTKEGQISSAGTEPVAGEDSVAVHTPDAIGTLPLETFGFPPEVEGCSCYFSKNKEDFENEKYIYIDDYGNHAFVKTGGNLIRVKMEEGDFDPENFNKHISNEEVDITITGKKVSELEEVMRFEGSMTVQHRNGQTITTPIYGECGC